MVARGGGRARASDAVDPRVGLSHIRPLGTALQAGEPLLQVHAATAADAEAACSALLTAMTIADTQSGIDAPTAAGPVVLETILPTA